MKTLTRREEKRKQEQETRNMRYKHELIVQESVGIWNVVQVCPNRRIISKFRRPNLTALNDNTIRPELGVMRYNCNALRNILQGFF